MRGPHNLWRLIRTGATFERTGAMKVALEAMEVPPRLRLLARVMGWPFKWLGYKGDPALPPVTRAITALGPAYIKFGQVLSTRPDVVGPELALQLRMLQDRLPPFDIATAKASFESDIGLPVDQVFSAFSEPVAAASIAQVLISRDTRGPGSAGRKASTRNSEAGSNLARSTVSSSRCSTRISPRRSASC